jgi:hypothetical protein
MKKKQIFTKTLVIVVTLGIGFHLCAQNPVTHHVGISIMPNYTTLFKKSPTIDRYNIIKSQWNGLGFSYGIYYQLEKGNFGFNIGIEDDFNISKIKFNRPMQVNANIRAMSYLCNSIVATAHAISVPMQFSGRFYRHNQISISAYGGLNLAFIIGAATDYYMDGKCVNRSYQAIGRLNGFVVNDNVSIPAILKFVMSTRITTGLTFEYSPTDKVMLSAAPQIMLPLFSIITTEESTRTSTVANFSEFQSISIGLSLRVSFKI